MKKIAAFAAILSLIIAIAGVVFFVKINDTENSTGEYAVTLNEIENMARRGEDEEAADAARALREKIRSDGVVEQNTDYSPLIMSGICIAFLAGTCAYWYVTVVRPLKELSQYAGKVGGGDLETAIEHNRGGLFGELTWALDSMRSEIKKARDCEKEAIENNKTVIASLSHDIKTPIATIRAYAEALDMGMDIDPEKHSRYVETILKKSDEVKALTEDMLTHSLTELGHLKMNPEEFELGSFLERTLDDLRADQDDIIYTKPSYSIDVFADSKRVSQIVENLIANARKYAKTSVTVTLTRDAEQAVMKFSDKGGGIPDSDLPFVLGKFYRGSNSSDEQGAGLGLFIVRYIAEQSGGSVHLRNSDGGLEVAVALPVVKD